MKTAIKNSTRDELDLFLKEDKVFTRAIAGFCLVKSPKAKNIPKTLNVFKLSNLNIRDEKTNFNLPKL